MRGKCKQIICVHTGKPKLPQATRAVSLQGLKSHIVCLKPVDLHVAKTKRGESRVEVCNYDDVQISKMSCV